MDGYGNKRITKNLDKSGTGSPVEQDEPGIEADIQNLHSNVYILSESVSLLRDRLEGVLRPEYSKIEGGCIAEGMPLPARSDLSTQVTNIGETLGCIQSKVGDILIRLDI